MAVIGHHTYTYRGKMRSLEGNKKHEEMQRKCSFFKKFSQFFLFFLKKALDFYASVTSRSINNRKRALHDNCRHFSVIKFSKYRP